MGLIKIGANTNVSEITTLDGSERIPVYRADVGGAYILSEKLLDEVNTYWYGIEYNQDTDTVSRRSNNSSYVSIPIDQSAGDEWLPIQAQMKRCLLNNDGTVNYYLNNTNSNLQADGITPSVLTGADGDVMVRIPKFYYRFQPTLTGYTFDISTNALSGFSPYEAFYIDGEWRDQRYISAYEGYVDDSNYLRSISGVIPTRSKTRAEFRTTAHNRGTLWRQYDWLSHTLLCWLFAVEYASFDTQGMIGNGRTALSDGMWEDGTKVVWDQDTNTYQTVISYITNTGLSDNDGNVTNSIQNGGSTGFVTDYMTYRGVENWYGHIWKFADFINVLDYVPYISNNKTVVADNTSTNYTRVQENGIDFTLSASNGYTSIMGKTPLGFLPKSISGGGSSSFYHDYYYQYSGNRVARVGGNSELGLDAGAFYLSVASFSSSSRRIIGTRACY